MGYQGGSEEKVDAKSAAIHDSKADLSGLPDLGFVVYIGLNIVSWCVFWSRLTGSSSVLTPSMMAVLLSAGPLVLAQLMANITDKTKRSVLYSFHKDGWRTMSGHLVISVLTTVLPVYILVHMALSSPGESVYFYLSNYYKTL